MIGSDSASNRDVQTPRTIIPVSASIVAIGLAATLLATLVAACGATFARLIFLWAAAAGALGIAMALSERANRWAWVCLGLSLALLSGNLLVARLAYGLHLNALILGTPLIGVLLLAPFLAPRLRQPGASVFRHFLFIWLAPTLLALLPIIFTALLVPGHMPRKVFLGILLGLPCGPWATQAAKLVSFPNAGEFFSLPLALVFSATLGAALYFGLSRRRWAAHGFALFAWLIIGWTAIAIGQLANCLE